MGPLLVTGAACFSGAVGLGLITAAAGRALAGTAEPAGVRSIYILSFASILGLGVLGVVVGIVAVTVARVGDASTALVAAVPGVAGTVAGVVLALRGGRSTVQIMGLANILGLGNLAVVVGVLDVFEGQGASIGGGEAPFVAIALVFLAAPIGLGMNGSDSIGKAAVARSVGPAGTRQSGTLEYIRLRVVGRSLLLQTVGLIAFVAATLLLVIGGGRTR